LDRDLLLTFVNSVSKLSETGKNKTSELLIDIVNNRIKNIERSEFQGILFMSLRVETITLLHK
jgi:hypothetical protein